VVECRSLCCVLNIFLLLGYQAPVCFRSWTSFEILGDKYINDHPDSEEISVKLKKNKLPPEIK
jgi:hypothetical protein